MLHILEKFDLRSTRYALSYLYTPIIDISQLFPFLVMPSVGIRIDQ